LAYMLGYRSTRMCSAISREVGIIEVMELTKRQRDIIIGTILGDGYLETKGDITRLQLKQSEEKKEYIFWLYEELKNLCKSAPKQRTDNRQWYVNTRYFSELTLLRKKFYRNKIKFVPKNIDISLQKPLSLAIWFMDDGTLDWRVKDHYAYRLTTNCFSIEDNELLAAALKKNFNVDATTQTTLIRGKRYPRIHIGAKGRDRFRKLVEPLALGCFKHKLPPIIFNPSETQPIRVG